jgi:hypothetical protein
VFNKNLLFFALFSHRDGINCTKDKTKGENARNPRVPLTIFGYANNTDGKNACAFKIHNSIIPKCPEKTISLAL